MYISIDPWTSCAATRVAFSRARWTEFGMCIRGISWVLAGACGVGNRADSGGMHLSLCAEDTSCHWQSSPVVQCVWDCTCLSGLVQQLGLIQQAVCRFGDPSRFQRRDTEIRSSKLCISYCEKCFVDCRDVNREIIIFVYSVVVWCCFST